MVQHLSSHNVFWKVLSDSHERLPFYKFASMAKSLGLKYISDYNLKIMLGLILYMVTAATKNVINIA